MLFHALLIACAAVLVIGILEMVRRRQLPEKYAALWLVVGVASVVLAVFPSLLDRSARLLGIAQGPNLLLFLAAIFLLLVGIHLSWEVGRLEDETRVLAEEIALLRLEMETALKE